MHEPDAILRAFPSRYFSGRTIIQVGIVRGKGQDFGSNDAPVAKMQGGRYFAVKLPAGMYAIRSADKGVGITLNTEDGKEYFVRIEMALGGFKSIQQVTEISRKQSEVNCPA